MANDTAKDVPGWVSLCGSVAPFAALVVNLAVSFSKQGCDRNAEDIFIVSLAFGLDFEGHIEQGERADDDTPIAHGG